VAETLSAYFAANSFAPISLCPRMRR
jgi:hypothetical protein